MSMNGYFDHEHEWGPPELIWIPAPVFSGVPNEIIQANICQRCGIRRRIATIRMALPNTIPTT